MTKLIYRGTAYTKTKTTTTPREPQKMIYRGVAHDGLGQSVLARTNTLCYRGVVYVKDFAGRIFLGSVPAVTPIGLGDLSA